MRTRSPWTGTPARAALLCTATSLTVGCSAINQTLVQDLHWIWFGLAVPLTLLIVGGLRWRAWHRALEDWKPPDAQEPGKGWTPLLVVGALFVWFAVYNFSLNPVPSPPEQQWWNAATWLLGSVTGTLVGWFGGKLIARRNFRRLYPGRHPRRIRR